MIMKQHIIVQSGQACVLPYLVVCNAPIGMTWVALLEQLASIMLLNLCVYVFAPLMHMTLEYVSAFSSLVNAPPSAFYVHSRLLR